MPLGEGKPYLDRLQYRSGPHQIAPGVDIKKTKGQKDGVTQGQNKKEKNV
jgi:hypothetical protein